MQKVINKYTITGFISLLIIIISLFLLTSRNTYKIEIDYNKKWTNNDLKITVKDKDGALYSFNNEAYTSSNVYYLQNNGDLSVKVKIKNKEYSKTFKISNIDKEKPIINMVTYDNNILNINAQDFLSGIKEYIYIVDGHKNVSTNSTYEFLRNSSNITLKIIDNAGNITELSEDYFQEDKITYTLSQDTWTNKDIDLTIIPKENYQEYAFSYNNEPQFNSHNTYKITKNGLIYVHIKTKTNILTETINITNIDKEKPKVSYKQENNTIKIIATDNSNDTLLYSWNNQLYSTQSEQTYTTSKNKETVSVKDKAGNITKITFNVTIANNEDTATKPVEGIPTNSSSTPKDENVKILPTIDIIYSETRETTNPVTITVITEAENEISYNYEAWTTTKTKMFTENVSNYSIRVKNKEGNTTQKIIDINNIREKTYAEKNQEIISEIYNTYGFKVSYGEGTYGYYGGACTVLYDHEKAYIALNEILPILKKFPPNFFRKFQGVNGYRIILFDDIPGSISGVAMYEIGNDNQIYLNVNNKVLLDRTFYHETWHLMEQYMKIENNWTSPFATNWTSLNPVNFSYGSTSSTVYTSVDQDKSNIANIAFISPYAKTNEREDRAELFADLMFRSYKRPYMNSGYGINEKAKVLALEIRKYWPNSVGATWEKYITW